MFEMEVLNDDLEDLRVDLAQLNSTHLWISLGLSPDGGRDHGDFSLDEELLVVLAWSEESLPDQFQVHHVLLKLKMAKMIRSSPGSLENVTPHN